MVALRSVLAALGQHFRRQRHRDPGQALAQILSEAEFVLRKGVRVQQAYGYGLYPLDLKPLGESPEFWLFEGHEDLAVGRHPLFYFEAQAALD